MESKLCCSSCSSPVAEKQIVELKCIDCGNPICNNTLCTSSCKYCHVATRFYYQPSAVQILICSKCVSKHAVTTAVCFCGGDTILFHKNTIVNTGTYYTPSYNQCADCGIWTCVCCGKYCVCCAKKLCRGCYSSKHISKCLCGGVYECHGVGCTSHIHSKCLDCSKMLCGACKIICRCCSSDICKECLSANHIKKCICGEEPSCHKLADCKSHITIKCFGCKTVLCEKCTFQCKCSYCGKFCKSCRDKHVKDAFYPCKKCNKTLVTCHKKKCLNHGDVRCILCGSNEHVVRFDGCKVNLCNKDSVYLCCVHIGYAKHKYHDTQRKNNLGKEVEKHILCSCNKVFCYDHCMFCSTCKAWKCTNCMYKSSLSLAGEDSICFDCNTGTLLLLRNGLQNRIDIGVGFMIPLIIDYVRRK